MMRADERVDSVDLKKTRRVMKVLREDSEKGTGVMVTLHSVEGVKENCERAIGVGKGRIGFGGHPSQLNDDLLHTLYGEELNQPH